MFIPAWLVVIGILCSPGVLNLIVARSQKTGRFCDRVTLISWHRLLWPWMLCFFLALFAGLVGSLIFLVLAILN